MASDIANSVIPAHPLEDYAWRSDYTLPESSQAELRGLLEGLRDVLSEHDAKIARAQATLDQLLDERKSYVLRIDKLRSALAPHKKLPSELLSKIFKDCSSSPFKLTPHNIRDIIYSVFPQLTVCSRWREVTLNTRSLWDDISITYPGFHSWVPLAKTGYVHTTKLAQKIISRGTRSIAIFVLVDHSAVLPDAIDPMRNLIVPFSHRLTRINLTSTMHHIFDFLRSSSPSFPVLESLTLKGIDTGNPYEHESVSAKFAMFKNTPNLKVLKMRRFDKYLISLPLSRIQLPWDQLTTIDFRNAFLDPKTAHWLLSQCISAISCSLCLCSGNTPLATIFQPQLQLLSIINYGNLFLQFLTLSSLHSFKIRDRKAEDSVPGLLSLISRSHCALINLSIPKGQIPASLLDPLLELLPALEDLDISRTIIPIPTLERIAQGMLLPKLTSIHCKIEFSPLSLESFMDAVERTGAQESEVTRLRVASTQFPLTQENYTAAGWSQAIERFKKLVEKLNEEGRLIDVYQFKRHALP